LSKIPNWTILFLSALIILGLGINGFGAGQPTSKLDPTLRRLVKKNNQSLEENGEPLNLGPYADRLEVYTDRKPVQVEKKAVTQDNGTTTYEYRVPEGAKGYRLGVLIDARSSALVESKRVQVRTVAGDVMTATASLEQIERLARLKSVNYIEASKRVKLHLNDSVPLVGAEKLHKESPVLRGKGIIVGDVDSGIDYDHKDFRIDKNKDGDEESSRIEYIWDQVGNEDNGGPGPSPTSFGYGTEYTEEEIERDIKNNKGPSSGEVREADFIGHGTHVSGIMASDGSSNPNPSEYHNYIGMAPNSDIIMVKTKWTTTSIIDGVNYIFQKAENQGKPAVVNLSLGSHYGPHDGTSLFARAMDNLSGPGEIIVASAGNEGSSFIHGNDTVSPGSSSTFTFYVAPPEEGKVTGAAAINTWYPGESEFAATISSPNGEILTVPSGTQTSSLTTDGAILVDNASSGKNPRNGDKQLDVMLLGSANRSPNDITFGEWSIKISAPSGTAGGRFDSWYYHVSTGGMLSPPFGNNRMTVGIPGVAKGVITVGAEMTKTRWAGADGEEYGYSYYDPSDEGNIASFSSWGPTRDGRLKPEITAPGMGIASTLSRSYGVVLEDEGRYDVLVTRDEQHVIMQGTSMSAPMVSGQVALMLQQDSDLSPSEVESRLINTANTDQYTSVGYDPGNPRFMPGSFDSNTSSSDLFSSNEFLTAGQFDRNVGPTANNTWGHGKLDSAQASRTFGFPSDQLDEFKVKFGPNPAPASEQVHLYYQLPGNDSGTLKVFNASGRQVYSASLPSGQNVHHWSLKNKQGEPLANGIYIYVVTAGDRTSDIGKLMIERR